MLEPVPQSTSLFNAVKFAMAFCTGVFSGTFGMQMLVPFGDHVVFDRGKSIESLCRPFHQTDFILSAAVPVKLLWSSPQIRMVFLQDANVAVQQLTDMQLLQNSLVFSEVIWIQFRRPVAVDTLRSHSVPAGKLFVYDQSTVQMHFVLSWCGWLPRTMMRWAEHGTVTRASVQLSIQYKKNSREKEDACLQLHVVFDVQFREVDCQNSLVSPERRISLQSKGGFRVDKPRNFTLVQGPQCIDDNGWAAMHWKFFSNGQQHFEKLSPGNKFDFIPDMLVMETSLVQMLDWLDSYLWGDNVSAVQGKHFSVLSDAVLLNTLIVLTMVHTMADCSKKQYNLGMDIEPEVTLYSNRSLGKLRMDEDEGALSDAYRHSQSDMYVQLIQLSWDPGGVNNSGLGASRILSGGECQGLGQQVAFQAGLRDGLPSNSRWDGRSE